MMHEHSGEAQPPIDHLFTRPPRKSWMQRLAREGSIPRRLLDFTLGSAMLGTFLFSAINTGGTSAVASPRSSSFSPPPSLLPLFSPPLAGGQDAEAAFGAGRSRLAYDVVEPDQTIAPLPLFVLTQSSVSVVATFGCDVPAGHYCAFVLFRGDGTRQVFGLSGGQRGSVRVTPNADRYLVAVDTTPPQTLAACPMVQAQGHFCKVAMAHGGYNN